MTDQNVRINRHAAAWRLNLGALSLLIGVAACSQSEAPAPMETPTSETPAPRYDQKDGEIYMYIGALTDEEQKANKRAPVVSFRYLGQKGDEQRLAELDDSGNTVSEMRCSYPCRVATATSSFGITSRVAVRSGTILDAAFTDAFNGLLMVSRPAVVKPPADVSPRTVPTVQQSTSPRVEPAPEGSVSEYDRLNNLCRGATDPDDAQRYCAERDRVAEQQEQ